jgi:hypothetical protein
MTKSISCAIATTADNLATVNTAAEQMGWGPNSLTVPLYDANGNITHYGCHTWVDDSFTAVLDSQPDIKAMISIGYGESSQVTFSSLLARMGLTTEVQAPE